MKIHEMKNADLRKLSGEVDAWHRLTQRARLAQHALDANRIAVRVAQQRDTRRLDPLRVLPEARKSARYNRTPSAWSRYGAIRQAVISPLDRPLP